MRKQLERQARLVGIADRVTFLGWKSQQECAQHLRESDALVLPSIFECGGAVVLEAMACGLPVIATDWGGPADYLDDTCGVLIKPDSEIGLQQGFATAMGRLASDPQLRESLGNAGRERVEQLFDWGVKIDQMISVYRELVPHDVSPATATCHSALLEK